MIPGTSIDILSSRLTVLQRYESIKTVTKPHSKKGGQMGGKYS